MGYKNLFCFFMIASTGSSEILCEKEVNQKPGYIVDESGRTLIFKAEPERPDARIIIPASFIILTGSKWLYDAGVSKDIFKERIISGSAGALAIGIGVGMLYWLYHDLNRDYQNQKNIPLIILDNIGIWHEDWKNQILWTDIKDITLIKVNRREYDGRGNVYDRGHFWKIELRTERNKTWTLDERDIKRLHVPPPTHHCGPFDYEKYGGQLGYLVLQYYDKYKSDQTIESAKNSSPNRSADEMPL